MIVLGSCVVSSLNIVLITYSELRESIGYRFPDQEVILPEEMEGEENDFWPQTPTGDMEPSKDIPSNEDDTETSQIGTPLTLESNTEEKKSDEPETLPESNLEGANTDIQDSDNTEVKEELQETEEQDKEAEQSENEEQSPEPLPESLVTVESEIKSESENEVEADTASEVNE